MHTPRLARILKASIVLLMVVASVVILNLCLQWVDMSPESRSLCMLLATLALAVFTGPLVFHILWD